MDRGEFNDTIMLETFKRIKDLSDRKGQDYSGNGDVLTSFKSNATYLGMSPKAVWGVLVLKHWDALMTYVRTGKLESEGIDQRIDDIIVYMLLLKAMIAEETPAS